MNQTHSIEGLEAKVRDYVAANFFVPDPSQLRADTSLLNTGIVDSTGYLEVFAWIRDEFGVHVEDAEMGPDNFETVGNIARYLHRKLG